MKHFIFVIQTLQKGVWNDSSKSYSPLVAHLWCVSTMFLTFRLIYGNRITINHYPFKTKSVAHQETHLNMKYDHHQNSQNDFFSKKSTNLLGVNSEAVYFSCKVTAIKGFLWFYVLKYVSPSVFQYKITSTQLIVKTQDIIFG